MVKAILEGKKTQTRKPINPQPIYCPDGLWQFYLGNSKQYYTPSVPIYAAMEMKEILSYCPYGKVGDRLWVKETFGCFDRASAMPIEGDELVHRADKCDHPDGIFSGWKPAIHMPRWVSRITLEITDVRVEKLKIITETEAIKEGMVFTNMATARGNFALLWNKIYGRAEYVWNNNPWVWVIEIARRENKKGTPEGG